MSMFSRIFGGNCCWVESGSHAGGLATIENTQNVNRTALESRWNIWIANLRSTESVTDHFGHFHTQKGHTVLSVHWGYEYGRTTSIFAVRASENSYFRLGKFQTSGEKKWENSFFSLEKLKKSPGSRKHSSKQEAGAYCPFCLRGLGCFC